MLAAVFTVNYNNATSNGTIDFGYIDSSKYTGDIGYAPITPPSSTEWAIQVTGLQLANGTLASKSGWPVIVDTGTATGAIPQDVAADYFSQVDGSTYSSGRETYTFPCSADLVDFTFALGSFKGTIPASHLAKGSIDGGKTCISKIKVNESGGNSIWGQAFIEEFFVVFDWDGARVGFASKSSARDSSSSGASGSNSTANGTSSTTSGESSASGAGSLLGWAALLVVLCSILQALF